MPPKASISILVFEKDIMQMIQILLQLLFGLLIAGLVYKHYRKREVYDEERYSTFWPRFWAPSIDSIILWPVSNLLPFLIFKVFPSAFNAASILVTLLYYAYSIYFHGTRGGTIGKLKCKIKVVSAKNEQKIGLKKALIRDAIPLLLSLALYVYILFLEPGEFEDSQYLSIVPVIYGLWFLAEIITMLTNKKRRALHDFLAGTVVVRSRSL